MDRMLYVAMSGAKQTMLAQAANNHNLANSNTVGFKADLLAMQNRAVDGPGYASRVYATDGSIGWDNGEGALMTTGNPLDVAVRGQGWIAVQDASGNEAYTRAGDLHVDANGQLQTATGLSVLGDNGPIALPPYTTVTVGGDGTISIVPQGSPVNTVSSVAQIKLVNPGTAALQRGADGLFRTTDGQPANADANVKLASGVLEASNVDLADAMVNMIDLSRHYELQIKALHSADENAQSATKLLSNNG